MKKIGIITIIDRNNIGNRLQNYATQEILKELGFQVFTINRNIEDKIPTFKKNKLNKGILKRINDSLINRLNYKYEIKENNAIKGLLYLLFNSKKIGKIRNKKENIFEDFNQNYINMTEYFISKKYIPYDKLNFFDFFITGSDQVWNPNFSQTSMIDFLTFSPKEKRIAFAPSFGVDDITENKKEIYAQWITDIPFLSVREEQGRKIINNLTNKEAIVLLDPTLLLSKEKWIDIEKKPEITPEGSYLLCFFLGNITKEYSIIMNKIAKRKSMKIINLCNIKYPHYYAVGPREFIFLIRNASFVCTDSFHGTAFSILFKKDFIVFNKNEGFKDKNKRTNSMISRLSNILKKFNQENRFFDNIDMNKLFSINYSNLDFIVQFEREKTIEYLKKSLNS